MATAIVADGSANILWHSVEIADQLLDGFRFEIRVTLDSLVDIRHIRTVVTVMVNLHRQGIDVRFQRIEGVRQRWELVCHCANLLKSQIKIL